ncbi:flagellar basal-body MS-ring/collar protein FliF [Mitsuokella sp. oral taxon 131]|uniref:flagellar basal-body MS-ring/collar protein FliF n=1 Tax=Mitsuokella sp. oral taxon 131 TaxID=1321780 RepID=UPI0003AD8578|nr:flagellar basal-body MS-ring/collar protein FliF [Mitsuokella sp. oral taxon 131]ERL03599.1 flagellar M-ring protein FliF [Mitsuokella sp. oral taxon 131 str. W9106]
MGDWKERYLNLWNKYSKRQRYIMLGAALAVLIAIVGVSVWYGSKPDMVPLFTNMETKDAGEVAAQLKESKIAYEVQENKQGTTILVPSKNVHTARLDLATKGLPHGQKGFEIFDDSKLGVTEFQNKVNYLQALQGELTRTIEQIDAVEKARVHIVLPEDSLYKKNEKPATASIMLRLKPNAELTKKEIKGIVNLAAHSIQGLQPENITIVDETGKILNDPDDQDEKGVGARTLTQLEMTKKVQDRIQKNVQSLLDQALGEGKAYARISVELDFDDRQTDKQTFTPVVDDSGIVRSQQDTSETYSGTSTNPGGPAGVQSNVPGYVAGNTNANADYEKKESTKNYEINEEKQKVVSSPGSIRRLNVAVLVNDDVSGAQQDSIMRAVSNAAGINTDRGDTISVEPLPLSTELRDRLAAEAKAAKDKEDRILYMQIAGVLLVLALIIGGIMMYRRKKQQEREALEEQQRLAALEQEREAEERAAALEAGEVDEGELTEEEQRHLDEKQALQGLIDQKPAEVAMLIKTWLSEDE